MPLGFMWNMAQGIVDKSAALISVVNLSCIVRISSTLVDVVESEVGLGICEFEVDEWGDVVEHWIFRAFCCCF